MGNRWGIDEAISAANDRLKAGGVRVRVKRRKQALYLRATLPGKPGTGKTSDRYEIALGVTANPAGLKRAEAEAKRLDSEVTLKQFRWKNWVRQKESLPESKTVGKWVEEFRADYMRRGEDSFSLTTWKTEYEAVLKKLPQDAELSAQLLYDAIACTKENTRTRTRYCVSLKVFARFAGIELDVKDLKGSYSSSEVQPRDIPEDELIVQARELITDPAWRYLYGYLAAFGLRPCEAWAIDWDSVAQSEEGEILVVGAKSRKQEKRLCYPVHPHWWSEWDLRNGRMPETTLQTNRDRGNLVCHAFTRYKIPFTPYDLRHAFAVRSLLLGIPETITAKWMGHSVTVHNRTYHSMFKFLSENIACNDKSRVSAFAENAANIKILFGKYCL